MTTDPRSTLFHRLGGAVMIRQIVDDLYHRLLADPTLAPVFVGADLRELRRHQYETLAAAMGGLGSEPARLRTGSLVGMAYGDEHFERALSHLLDTLEAFGTEPEIVDEVVATIAPLRPAIVTA